MKKLKFSTIMSVILCLSLLLLVCSCSSSESVTSTEDFSHEDVSTIITSIETETIEPISTETASENNTYSEVINEETTKYVEFFKDGEYNWDALNANVSACYVGYEYEFVSYIYYPTLPVTLDEAFATLTDISDIGDSLCDSVFIPDKHISYSTVPQETITLLLTTIDNNSYFLYN